MARARNIKPGFFANEELVELSAETRLLFIGLWTLADREGRLEDRPKRIKIQLFPYDTVDVDAMLNSLASTGFLFRYEVLGQKFVQVVNFHKHQMPHHKEAASEIPPPPGVAAVTRHVYDVSKEKREEIFERDGNCLKCGSKENLSLDHIVPLAKGGDNTDVNLQTLCVRCNSSKGDSTKDYRQSNVDPTLNQRQTDVGASCPPDSLIVGSLNPSSLNPSSWIPESLPLANARVPATAGAASGPKTRKASAKRPAESSQVWDAYAVAYERRYGVAPVRNARVNANIATLIVEVGIDDAPAVAAFYVQHDRAFYVSQTHSTKYLAADAAGLRTQWANGRSVMAKDAHEKDRVASEGGMWNRVGDRFRTEEIS